MNYNLATGCDDRPATIIVVGVGGTGGFLAESLCRLTIGRQDHIILIDHDIVERHNLLRQNFHRGDIGRFKSEALAERLSTLYDRPVGYSVHPFNPDSLSALRAPDRRTPLGLEKCLIAACVDNAAARADIAQAATSRPPLLRPWVIDAGNGQNWGQVLIGDTQETDRLSESFGESVCYHLPLPTVQRPDLLTYVPDDPPDLDCAAAMDLTDQDPTINQAMAALATQVIRRILAGNCCFMSLYIDQDAGAVVPTYATPENVSRVTGLPVTDLIQHTPEFEVRR